MEMLNVYKITIVISLFREKWGNIEETCVSPSIKYSLAYIYITTFLEWFLFLELNAAMYDIEEWTEMRFRVAGSIIVSMLNNYFAKRLWLIEDKLFCRWLGLCLFFLLFLLLFLLGIFFHFNLWNCYFHFFIKSRQDLLFS